MALRYMLAASAPWYLPALFLACLSWAMAFQVLDVVRQRPFARRIYVLLPPGADPWVASFTGVRFVWIEPPPSRGGHGARVVRQHG